MKRISTETCHLTTAVGEIFTQHWRPMVDSAEAPLVLLHDSLGCVGLWKDFPAQLAERLQRQVIAYDRAGFGRSCARTDLPTCDFIEQEADRYFPAIKTALGLGEYMLLGHSVGGAMAISIAARDPDCLGVISIAAQAFIEDLTRQGIRQAQNFFAQPGQLDKLRKWHDSKAEWVLSAWTSVWLSEEFSCWSLAPALHKLNCPLLVVHGDEDEYGSLAFPQYLSSQTAGPVELIVLQGCRHLPHREHPETVTRAVQKFLSNIGTLQN